MSTAGVAAQEIRVPLKAFLHDGQALGSLNACWGRRRELGNNFLNIHPITMAYNLKSTTQAHLTSLDKPEVPPRVPIPPRPVKPDYRRWSAEVTSSTYSDEDRPPKVPPREPLSRSNSRTPVHGHTHRASPHPDTDKPEVPPRVPIPPRPVKPDYRRWSAEVTSSTYSDEDRPPKVPPREPLSRSNSRTPSPKSLPSYLNGVMPPTQSFAPDPKYVSSKALQRQLSEGSASRAPCILPIIENGKKVSSTHYYLLPERPPYLDRYEKFFTEAEEAGAGTQVQPFPADGGGAAPGKLDPGTRGDVGGHGKRKHLSYVVSP
ncbi:ERBB receptor feedback inhibitor 1 [Myotis davidii]|uniref:ERBB receptor feedback inhibitor 1 n=1 Tax=Myotis davidii TaxID=225400 RepID=L5LRC7_MYODS|nr:ERBB receptor feedback inhibitor 1 [Myotis davidii]